MAVSNTSTFCRQRLGNDSKIILDSFQMQHGCHWKVSGLKVLFVLQERGIAVGTQNSPNRTSRVLSLQHGTSACAKRDDVN